MTFSLTKEQRLIQTYVREFARKVILPSAAERDRTKAFPKENLQQMAGLGLMGMMAPAAYGGEETDTVSYVLALTEIAYACAATAVIMSVHNSIVCESIAAFGSENQKKTIKAAMAKLFASGMVNRVTARAIQLHGGYGVIREYPLERYYRDARVFTIYEGTSEIQRVVISNGILKDKKG